MDVDYATQSKYFFGILEVLSSIQCKRRVAIRILEYEAKAMIREAGIDVPVGSTVTNLSQVQEVLKKVGMPVVVKPQTLTKGRGKAGLIRFAHTANETERTVFELLQSDLRGEKVRKVLIEEKIELDKELYAGLSIDRTVGKPAIIVSAAGGVDVEETAAKSPMEIISTHVDVVRGIREHEVRRLVKEIGLAGNALADFAAAVHKLYVIFRQLDAWTVEVNPFALTKDRGLIALDAVIEIDDDALYRHRELQHLLREPQESTRLEDEARKAGFAYVEMDGDIGVLGNGAGLTMATLDIVQRFEGQPAYFLDIGGGVSPEEMKKALELALMNRNAKSILVNIFAGINRCDSIANGIKEVHKRGKLDIPLAVRLAGTNEKEGRAILKEIGIDVYNSTIDAVKKAVSLSKVR